MRKQSITISLLLCVALVAFTSCRKKQSLEVSKSLIAFSFAGGTEPFKVTADCDWTVEVDNTQSWLTVSPTSGSSNDSVVTVTASRNSSVDNNRNTTIAVVSANGKIRREILIAQNKIDISAIARKVWFLRTNERWDTDYFNNVIPESYRSITYYSNPGFENWFFYFLEDSTGYQVRTYQGDTLQYHYHYIYYPKGDSLNMRFEAVGDSVEDYHTIIHILNNQEFGITNPYRPHQYERLYMVNVTGDERGLLNINPKNTALKPKGPLVPMR